MEFYGYLKCQVVIPAEASARVQPEGRNPENSLDWISWIPDQVRNDIKTKKDTVR